MPPWVLAYRLRSAFQFEHKVDCAAPQLRKCGNKIIRLFLPTWFMPTRSPLSGRTGDIPRSQVSTIIITSTSTRTRTSTSTIAITVAVRGGCRPPLGGGPDLDGGSGWLCTLAVLLRVARAPHV